MNFYEQLVGQAGSNFYRYAPIYQSGSSPYALSTRDDALPYADKVQALADAVCEADAILVGAASGLSSAAGFDFYYGDTPSFHKLFGKYGEKYGYTGTFDGIYYPYRRREEFWGFLLALLHYNLHAPAGQTYLDLDALLQGKPFHVLTTNQDTQFTRLYPEEKLSSIQGDFRFFQCSRPCCDEVFDARELIDTLYSQIDDDLNLPADKIPRCPHCGAEMSWWVRGPEFLQGKRYHEQYDKTASFIAAHEQEKLLFLELGVGRMTPMFIQEPFWNLTLNLPQARYISINAKDALLPQQLEARGTAIRADLAQVLADARAEVERRRAGA